MPSNKRKAEAERDLKADFDPAFALLCYAGMTIASSMPFSIGNVITTITIRTSVVVVGSATQLHWWVV
jgi:hypothetical protein